MPTAIIAGLPADIERRVKAALKQQNPLSNNWEVSWLRSNGRLPGLAPGQLEAANRAASDAGGAHLLIFRGRERNDEEQLQIKVAPYFRVRWLDHMLLRLIPHKMGDFLAEINRALSEELEWIEKVKPKDESCCLLLPECAFSAGNHVRHIWAAANESGIERIRLAAIAAERFHTAHWLPHKTGPRAWIDDEGKVFDHRGARHGLAPFPRSWKFSYRVADGFHFDVTSHSSRAFRLVAFDDCRHAVPAAGHINIDAHGVVRA